MIQSLTARLILVAEVKVLSTPSIGVMLAIGSIALGLGTLKLARPGLMVAPYLVHDMVHMVHEVIVFMLVLAHLHA